MTRRRMLLAAGLALAGCLHAGSSLSGNRARTDVLPDRLTDQAFWRLVIDLSEPEGAFRSDNLLSNELRMQHVIPELERSARPGRVYLGVGPEQNFTYIAALRPSMVFIVDVRRGNLDLHLLYKALFELSATRSEFVSKLFSRRQPDGLSARSSVAELFEAYSKVTSSDAQYADNVGVIKRHLTTTHGFALEPEDLAGIEHVYHAFHTFGPQITYSSTGSFGGRSMPTYADLMVATDGNEQMRGFLSSDETFAVVKDLEQRNLIVPIVGNFAGPKAIRSVGAYLKEKGATVSAFYLSNVEQYLNREASWPTFCANVATLPLDEASRFIRSVRRGGYGPGPGLQTELGSMAVEVKSCGTAYSVFIR